MMPFRVVTILATFLSCCVLFAGQSRAGSGVALVTDSTHIEALAFSPDGRYLASGASGTSSQNHGVTLWNVATGKAVANYNPDVRGSAASLVFSRDGKVLYVGGLHDPSGATGSLRVLSIPDLTERAAWPSNTFPPYQVAVSPDGMTVAAALPDPALNFYAADTGQVIRSQPLEEADYTTMGFSPDGKMLALGNSFGFWLYNILAPGFVGLRSDTSSKYAVQALAFTPDGKTIVTGDRQGFIKFIDAATRQVLRIFQIPFGAESSVDAVVVSPDGKTVYATGMLPSSEPRSRSLLQGIVALDVATAKPFGLIKAGDTFGQEVQKLAITADGKRLAASSNGDNTIWLLDTSTVIPLDKLR